jgi:probable HAF family extracellular repeat protein
MGLNRANGIMKTNPILLALAFLPASFTFAHAQAPQYTVTVLGELSGGDGVSYATGVNNLGQVTGQSATATSNHAFLYSNGSMIDIGAASPDYSVSFGEAINNNGQVAGVATTGILYSGGSWTSLGDFAGGQGFGAAYGINDSGVVVGEAQINGSYPQAFSYSNGTLTNLGSLGGNYSTAYGINSSGVVVGSAYLSGNSTSKAFEYSSGVMSSLGTLGGSNSDAYGINNSGQVVGASQITGNSAYHAVLFSGGSKIDLGTLGGSNSYGYAINSSGEMTGMSQTTGNASTHAFVDINGTMYDLSNLMPNGVTGLDQAQTPQVGNQINDWGQIAAEATVNGTEQAILINPVNPLTSVSAGVQDARLVSGMKFSAISAYANTTGNLTNAAFLDGTASRNRDVQVSFLAATAGLKSDIAQLSITAADGTTTQDKFVLSLSYTGSATGAFLGFFNTTTGTWQNAVMGNSDGGAGANFINGAYNSATDFVLGDYGIDTSSGTAWAVVDHNSEFAVIPEPSTWAMLAAGAFLLIACRLGRQGFYSPRSR